MKLQGSVADPDPYVFGSGSGSTPKCHGSATLLQGIQTDLSCWIRMRIHIRKADPDPGIRITLFYGI
jgi:hypothetical protein